MCAAGSDIHALEFRYSGLNGAEGVPTAQDRKHCDSRPRDRSVRAGWIFQSPPAKAPVTVPSGRLVILASPGAGWVHRERQKGPDALPGITVNKELRRRRNSGESEPKSSSSAAISLVKSFLLLSPFSPLSEPKCLSFSLQTPAKWPAQPPPPDSFRRAPRSLGDPGKLASTLGVW